MAVQRVADNALTISVRPAKPVAPAQARKPAVTLDVYRAAKRDGAPAPVAEPFKNPTNYKAAVEYAEAMLKGFRGKQSDAEAAKAQAEQAASAKLQEAIGARDSKNAQASKPLTAAKDAREAKRKELQAPIDDTTTKLAEARADLEIATFPNKRDLDKARSAAHAESQRRSGILNAAQSKLDGIVNQLSNDRSSLSTNRNGLAQSRTEAMVVGSNLVSARDLYERARYNTPSQYDWDRTRRQFSDVTNDYRNAESEVRTMRDRVEDRRSELNRLIRDEGDRPTPPTGSGNDRPTPPSGGSDRPTPPSGGSDRPTPPSGGSSTRPTPPSGSSSTRPTPPSGSSSGRPTPPPARDGESPEISRAREALSSAERDLDNAQGNLNSLSGQLDDVTRRYRSMESKINEFDRREQAVRILEGEMVSLQNNITIYENNIRTLENRIAQYDDAKPGAIGQRDKAASELEAANAYARKLDQTQYDKGDPAKIQPAQAKVDRIDAQLQKYRQTYTEGMKAPDQRVAKEQATYDATMAPFHQTVSSAQEAKVNAIANANKVIESAKAEVQQGEGEIAKLKNVSGWKKFIWAWPKWLFGSGFSVNKFWKDRPAA